MVAAILKAHDDGKNLVIDEPYDLPTNQPLVVHVMTPDAERAEWHTAGAWSLSRAYAPADAFRGGCFADARGWERYLY